MRYRSVSMTVGLVGAMLVCSGARADTSPAPTSADSNADKSEEVAQPVQTSAKQSPDASSPQEEAMERFNRAVGLYEEQDYAAALIEFKRAYDLAPTYKLLYQIGQVSYKLRDYAGALRAFEQYLREGGNEISAQRRYEVQEEINLLKEQTGKIQVSVNVFGASVTIDDVAVGETPLDEPILVSIGERKVTVSAAGRQTVTRVVEVAGRELKTVNIELPAVAGEVRTVYEQQDKPSKMTAWSWVGVGAAGALGVGATISGIVALRSSNRLKDMSYVGVEPSQAIKDEQKKVKNLALTTDVLAGAAIVTLATTLIVTFTRPDPDPVQDTKKATAHHQLTLRPSLGLGSVGLVGDF